MSKRIILYIDYVLETNYRYINELVSNVKKGDMESLAILCSYYEPLIKASINRTVKKDKKFLNLKEDLLTESFLIFKDFCDSFDSNLSYFSYYVSTRIDPYLLNKAKQLSGFSEKVDFNNFNLNQIEEKEDIYDPFNKLYVKQTLEQCIEKLPTDLQLVIDYYYYKNLNQMQCADLMNVSQPTFSRKLKKALNILKINIPEDLYE